MSGRPGWEATPEARRRAALDYVRDQRDRRTRETVTTALRTAGYTDEDIALAWQASDAEEAAVGPGVIDRRRQVAAIIALAYLGTWGVFTAGWLGGGAYVNYGTSVILVVVMTVTLGIVGLLGVLLARRARGLRRASLGTAAAMLFVPALILAGVAGFCALAYPPFAPAVS